MSTAVLEKPPQLLTGSELWRMGDIGPCELIKGRIVKMSYTGFRHGFVELNLAHILKLFVTKERIGWVVTGDVGIYTQYGPDTIRGADVVFVSKIRLSEPPDVGFLEIAPELIVEVLSPNDKRQNVRDKITEYLAIGVEWVWVVDPRAKTLRVYRPDRDVQIFSETDTLPGEGILQGFSLRIADIFEE